jgi:SAM-dependent methyltransferase
MKCRHCQTHLKHTFIDLGFAPPSNAYLTQLDLNRPEIYFPLKIKVCDCCWLVQTEDYADADKLFTAEYAYFSSVSASWLEHARVYSKQIIDLLALNEKSFVIELASNDGYLLKNFLHAGIPCLGIEPTKSTALEAEKLGISVLQKFFGEMLGKQIAEEQGQADLIIANNVYAHVPDINDFTKGMKAALKKDGVITIEFPHLLRLIKESQFDTIYHEHFSYLSLQTVVRIFATHGLRVWDVEQLNTHGGSLRVYGCHENDPRQIRRSVEALLALEIENGLDQLETYFGLQMQANRIKDELITFLINQKKLGKKVVAYGAAAKGNTLLNYAGIKSDLLSFVCDAAKSKQGHFMPGSHIPILPPDHLVREQPDFVLILPWNIADEVKTQLAVLLKQNTKFVTAIPTLSIA